jgi:uncharacterized protein CbrC (UPF0167 family)
METFDDLGMPFPLFQAPIESACVERDRDCSCCGTNASILFEGACYACFRAGKVDHTIDTEFGMVRREDAERGLTHGIPLGDPSELPDYELVPHAVDPNFPDEQWYSVRFSAEALRELVRTPKFHSWQGERWLFCCKRPCVFIGDLPLAALEEEANGNEKRLLKRLSDIFGTTTDESEDIRRRIESDSICTYAFRCSACGRLRAYWDMD